MCKLAKEQLVSIYDNIFGLKYYCAVCASACGKEASVREFVLFSLCSR